MMSRPLDRDRPLWEVYLVEGLAEDRFAIISKTHHALVDGVTPSTSPTSSSTRPPRRPTPTTTAPSSGAPDASPPTSTWCSAP